MRPRKEHIYYSLRSVMLTASIFLTIVWVCFGFDTTVEELFNPEWAGMGVHWSTIQTLSLSAYFFAVNFQLGGIPSFKILLRELKRDFKAVYSINIRKEYVELGYAVAPLKALIASLCLALVPLFVFEIPYVFLLNYFHFEHWFYPVYMYETNFLSAVFFRNFELLIIPLLLSFAVLKYKSKYKLKLRLDIAFFYLGLFTLLSWGLWITYDSKYEPQTIETLELDHNKTWTLPKQELFPQNTYIYMNTALGVYYERENLFGWHQDEWQVHALNVWVKYMVFISVGYLFMVKVEI